MLAQTRRSATSGDVATRSIASRVQGALGFDGSVTAEVALQRLLAETNLRLRRAQSGAWIVERPDTPPLAQPDAPVPEVVIVTGRRLFNADIRRSENDVQPYKVPTKAEILGAHRDDVDQYFRSRVTSNASVIPPSLTQSGSTQSEFDVRGLGAASTLVLVDGRRMPGLPAARPGLGGLSGVASE